MASFWNRFQQKYLISIRSQKNFLESVKVSLSPLEILSILTLLSMLMFGLFYTLFRYTNLNLLVDKENHSNQELIALNQTTDSIEKSILQQEQYYQNIQRILNGESLEETEEDIDSQQVAKIKISDPSKAELSIRERINHLDNISITERNKSVQSLLPPIQGVISSAFNQKNNHFGIDIVAPKNSPVKTIADGKVLYSSWNADDGHSMIITHQDNFISIYKHCEKLLKVINEPVEAGDAIAIVGDSGENTTGYHLHFELWKDNVPVNPKEYINFEK